MQENGHRRFSVEERKKRLIPTPEFEIRHQEGWNDQKSGLPAWWGSRNDLNKMSGTTFKLTYFCQAKGNHATIKWWHACTYWQNQHTQKTREACEYYVGGSLITGNGWSVALITKICWRDIWDYNNHRGDACQHQQQQRLNKIPITITTTTATNPTTKQA